MCESVNRKLCCAANLEEINDRSSSLSQLGDFELTAHEDKCDRGAVW